MPTRIKRYQDNGDDHFITFSCYRRLPYLNNDHARTTFLKELGQSGEMILE
jgi:putative transposase